MTSVSPAPILDGLPMYRGQAHREVRDVVIWYCLLQAIAVVIWWVMLFQFPETKLHFWPESMGEASLKVLLISDLVTYVAFGVLVACLAQRDSKWLRPFLWMMLGGIFYATLISLSATISTGQAALGAALMCMSWLGFLHLVLAEYFSERNNIQKVFRNASGRTPKGNLFVTSMQLLVFWPSILGLFPWLIAKLQALTPLAFFTSSTSIAFGWFVFLVASVINLHTAWTMATFGSGTPFPYDKTNRLVVRGLYRWIRNPMALTGLAQGAGVGLMYGSVMVLVYVVCGGLIWQFLVRPIEEEMLADQFGTEYLTYQRAVGLWIPKWRQG